MLPSYPRLYTILLRSYLKECHQAPDMIRWVSMDELSAHHTDVSCHKCHYLVVLLARIIGDLHGDRISFYRASADPYPAMRIEFSILNP